MNTSPQRIVLPPISTLFNDVDRQDSRPPKLTIQTSPSIIVTDQARHSAFQPPSPQSPVPASDAIYKSQSLAPPYPPMLSPVSTPVSPQLSQFESSPYLSPLPPPATQRLSPDFASSDTLQIPHLPSHSRSYPNSPVDRIPMSDPFKRRASDQTNNTSANLQYMKASAPPRRRRGRPPNATEQNTEGPWTFLTPTVWDVGAVDEKRDQDYYTVEHKADDHTVGILCDMSMDSLLSTPKRKRGRKPKHVLEGNGCFVWKEIKSKRRSRKQLQ
ncbi:hypothetical protein K450DRAFT_230814 [Umbelopsis ramanniana AG]|uniref:Uncharacterized protein n=1 Tax=Umbelopsis ramanniana AG TaxID=1314678 RepID=A0AAD5ED43_UMBRA|nr:uncharacterized protein K450DRAFT_230814 [Umbelopsis ramanniana AG]KAI8581706.1 hypothetical protein K450DRAFT_230814 [Umbelopsis ramanniana AG]